MAVLACGEPRSSRDIVTETGLSDGQVPNALALAWRAGVLMRAVEPFQEYERVDDGRAGVRPRHLRRYHMYILGPPDQDELLVDKVRFVTFDEDHMDSREGKGISKAGRVCLLPWCRLAGSLV